MNAAMSILTSDILPIENSRGNIQSIQADDAQEFVVGNLVWFSCLTSISLSPDMVIYSDLCKHILRQEAHAYSQTQFENVSGCEIWVRDVLLEIIALRSRTRNINVNDDEVASDALDIEERIECRILKHLQPSATFRGKLKRIQEGTDLDEVEDTERSANFSYLNTYSQLEMRRIWRQWRRKMVFSITHFLALGALIYLEAVLHRPDPTRPKIRHGISRFFLSLSALEKDQIHELLPHLLWPLYIIGCVAERDQQLMLGSLLESGKTNITDSGVLLQLLSKVWQKRENSPETARKWTWADIIEITGSPMLLI
jgi:hypothetical protein